MLGACASWLVFLGRKRAAPRQLPRWLVNPKVPSTTHRPHSSPPKLNTRNCYRNVSQCSTLSALFRVSPISARNNAWCCLTDMVPGSRRRAKCTKPGGILKTPHITLQTNIGLFNPVLCTMYSVRSLGEKK
ncbi:hypothetical protein B0J11DRAFT_288269 [Dendryphion nanum]|uniref:Uncharacterized protein n=1 Tax=Dendryphion nanum TaxID=256645 RepID=A0A9P9DUK7_9PLEO|nr:hypothetical protein B0J11DRAFT_288269 [Dendryphion nanum]